MTQFLPSSIRNLPAIAWIGLLSLPMLSACAGGGDRTPYPSLAVRPVEKQGFAEPVVKPVELRPDPALDRDIAGITDRLGTVEGEFTTAHDRAEASARAARGQRVGSDAWLAAQTDLATLDEIRARTSALLTEIDDRAIARAAELKPDYPALTKLRARAAAISERQAAQISALTASLPTG
ncbi:hypothetical protein [Sphingomonas sp. Leaf21]|uniref:hypothetical protein n=1 Tax=Sphingomonas sp. Leaf21 TaxID=2876550 RepID=UPI001E3B7FBA|nr:hypothetical protein [Sphingomonas sp. Leaf21]